jgi:hypothetical protein
MGGGQVVDDLETTRQSIVEAAARLGQLLDDSWRLYLALPEELFANVTLPTADKLDTVLDRFARVEQDARYRVLSQRQEFRRLKQLLQVYRQQWQTATDSAAR